MLQNVCGHLYIFCAATFCPFYLKFVSKANGKYCHSVIPLEELILKGMHTIQYPICWNLRSVLAFKTQAIVAVKVKTLHRFCQKVHDHDYSNMIRFIKRHSVDTNNSIEIEHIVLLKAYVVNDATIFYFNAINLCCCGNIFAIFTTVLFFSSECYNYGNIFGLLGHAHHA